MIIFTTFLNKNPGSGRDVDKFFDNFSILIVKKDTIMAHFVSLGAAVGCLVRLGNRAESGDPKLPGAGFRAIFFCLFRGGSFLERRGAGRC